MLVPVRRSEPSKQAGSLASLSDAPPLKSGLSSLAGAPSLKESESECLKVLDLLIEDM